MGRQNASRKCSLRPPRVVLSSRGRFTSLPSDAARRIVLGIFQTEHVPDPWAHLGLVFVDKPTITALNERYLAHRGPTDVLAFPLGNAPGGKDSGLWGEVVVCVDVAREEGRRRGIPFRTELLRYVAHGVLHLLGYRDEEPGPRARMRARERFYLRRFATR